MTPFGERVRAMRAERGLTLKDMADALGVSSAYLSALEHGKRGRPSWPLLQAIIQYFNVIWDEADELQRLAELSAPRSVIDTAGLSPQATAFANRLAGEIAQLSEEEIASLDAILDAARKRRSGPAA
ncbi:Transcriptional regulator, contains XRE-family HTH domain [Chelatococcus sambhunathii]|uniref:Transcriptional regulator n=2 Tax=Chelatococcus TaxID=28209 RepID=A0AAC9NXH5_9HYPH|nr:MULTISPECIES: helix-turn-helix transcriptional regulator [Chelatococcus]APF36053.1 transcriptional regulator [Chelatococcus daeguensis]CUA88689.1 Transcriptional regulator, contains XRE-family HTH domain [Chelatococcus sambhunathii]